METFVSVAEFLCPCDLLTFSGPVPALWRVDLAVNRIGVVRLAGWNESRGTLSRETLLRCGGFESIALCSALLGTSSDSSSSSSPSETKSLVGIPRNGRGMRLHLPLAIFRKSAGQFPLDSDVTLYHRFKMA